METINLDFLLKNKPEKAKDHGDKLNYGVQDPKVVQLCEFFSYKFCWIFKNVSYFNSLLGNDKGMKKDTYVIGNKGYKIWIEKLVDPKEMDFKSRYACTISSSINDEKIPSKYSLKDAVVSIIPGINFRRCQNKIPFNFGGNGSDVMNVKDLYCNFWEAK